MNVVPIEIDITIEVPRGSFVKRGSSGRVDFVSPLPCPYNYGAAARFIGLEGDLLDAVLLGPRKPFGSRWRTLAWGAITLVDRGVAQDKLICCDRPVTSDEKQGLLRFFRFYARCKALLNFIRRRPGRNASEGWCEAAYAIGRATPRTDEWRGPTISF